MKKFLFLLPFLFACGSDSDITPDDTFVKYFGTGGSYTMTDMTTTIDGSNIVMFGSKAYENIDADVDDTDMYVIIADQSGSLVDEAGFTITHQYEYDYNDIGGTPIPVEEQDLRYSVERPSRITTIDGGYLIVGTTQYPVRDEELEETFVDLIIYAQLDNNLDLVGDFGIIGDSVNNYVGVDIQPMTDGGILVGGYTDANGTNDFFYEKVGGLDQWRRIQTRLNSDDKPIRLMPTSSGNYALFGQTDALSEDGEGGVNVERTLISPEGVIINSLIYGNTSATGDTGLDDFPFDVVEKPGGFAIIGYSDVDGDEKPFLMNVDLTGASTNEVLYDDDQVLQNFEARGFSITQTQTNDIILVGDLIKYNGRGNEVLFMRTNQAGARLGEIKNAGVANGDDVGIRATTLPDGHILVGGTFDFGGGQTLFTLLKMNVDGELRK